MRCVLVVDDSPTILSLVKHVLGQAGFKVMVAEDGDAALYFAKRNTVDLVLTDINMPILDGIDLIGELRALPDYKYVPILVLTTESGGGKIMEGKAAGATGWIVKPLDPDQLVTTVKKVLS